MKEKEIWRPIPDYKGYMVSNHGVVMSPKGRILQTQINTAGYLRVIIRKKHLFVHRLVANAFLPKTNSTASEVNHKDCNKYNNVADNLEWVTRSENMKHAFINGRLNGGFLNEYGTRTPRKIINADTQEIYNSVYDAASRYEIKPINIYMCLAGYKKTACGFHWSYLNNKN